MTSQLNQGVVILHFHMQQVCGLKDVCEKAVRLLYDRCDFEWRCINRMMPHKSTSRSCIVCISGARDREPRHRLYICFLRHRRILHVHTGIITHNNGNSIEVWWKRGLSLQYGVQVRIGVQLMLYPKEGGRSFREQQTVVHMITHIPDGRLVASAGVVGHFLCQVWVEYPYIVWYPKNPWEGMSYNSLFQD